MLFKRTAAVLSAAALMMGASGMGEVFALDDDGVVITQQKCDINVIPDKYNTGCRGELTKVCMNDTVCGIQLKGGGDQVSSYMDFTDRNQDITGEVVIENYDFSGFTLRTRKEEEAGRDIKLIFKNCKFSTVEKVKAKSPVIFEFENCTFTRFSGSNAVLERCALGGSYQDAILPFGNVRIKDCYISDMVYPYPDGEVHIDGTQIYGTRDIDVENVSFDNCRFEIPYIRIEGTKATVNACIMLQVEYSNGRDITFTDCTLNGGGTYSIYATSKKREGYPECKMENIKFENIKVGCAILKGAVYQNVDKNARFKNLIAQDSLYVGSVYKDSGKTYFSVSNDTNEDRSLKIVTSKGSYDFEVPACPTGTELQDKKVTAFEDLPFDIALSVPEDCDYAVCLDTTEENNIRQIRFVNYTQDEVKLDKALFGGDEALDNNILYSGTCGTGVEYTFSKDNVLTISGSGKMNNFDSSKVAPWYGYVGRIKKVVIEEGVENIGNMAFRDGYALEEVTLSEGLVSIGSRAFACCASLRKLELPESVENINENAFTALPNCEIIGGEGKIPEPSSQAEDSSSKVEVSSSTEENSSALEDSSSKTGSDSTASQVSSKAEESSSESAEKKRSIGDVDGDGSVDIADAVTVISYINGSSMLTDEQLKYADVNGSGNVDIEDAVAIIGHINGIKALF